MLRLETTSRKALFLYGALLVLPTLVFGWLYWRELQKDFERQGARIPEQAQAGAQRIVTGMREQLARLIQAESQRPFTHYASVFSPEDAMGDQLALQRSPMVSSPAPPGILAWFSFDRDQGPDSEIHIFVGSDAPGREDAADRLRPIVKEFRRRKTGEDVRQVMEEVASTTSGEVPLAALAVNLGQESNLDCVRRCWPLMRGNRLSVGVSEFRLQFYRDEQGQPRAIVSRRVLSEGKFHPDEFAGEAPCLEPLVRGFHLQQGFLIDVNWLFQHLPFDIARQALDSEEELHTPPAALPFDNIGKVFAEILPVRELGFETYYPEDEGYGRLEVQIDTERFQERIERQSRRFLASGFMLLLTLATGMTLLYRSVRRELDQAHRMQNFVAAVTHELRTPISTIRLHSEMLLDGWVDGEKQEEYYRRIVRETNRLSTLVERVLEKSRLKENVTRPVPGDLNEHVTALEADLRPAAGDSQDLAFQLEPRLPRVWLTTEGITAILSNLVENARKYAPVVPDVGREPILVRTRWSNGRVLLEVADRGPGVPPSERERIFEAFYRVGSEQTRTTTGTGLGLHLVRLHAETCQAQVSVEDREGGGSIFRVAFRPAD